MNRGSVEGREKPSPRFLLHLRLGEASIRGLFEASFVLDID
jgi:hypothetical protein